MKQDQENWLFERFMRKRDARIWLGIITLLITGFIVANTLVIGGIQFGCRVIY